MLCASNNERLDEVSSNNKVWGALDLPLGDLVSIVVPVFNVKKYLNACIESLLIQTHANLEIVLVDDGSTDGSGEICDGYQQRDSRVRVVHQCNAGLSAARNAGTRIVTGDWITYVDSDDLVDPTYVELMLKSARLYAAPIVCCRFGLFLDTPTRHDSHESDKPIVLTGVEAACEVLSEKRASTSAWGKLAVASLWQSVSFPDGRKFEDLPVTWKLFVKSESAVLLQDRLYFYRKRPNSISGLSSATQQSVLDYALSIMQMLEETDSSEYSDELELAAAFRAGLESCRLYEMCLNKQSDSEAFILGKAYAKRCLVNTRLKAVLNPKAPLFQKLRIALLSASPQLIGFVLHKAGLMNRYLVDEYSDDIEISIEKAVIPDHAKKILCLGDTPFQIMALICIFSNKASSFEQCDLLIDPRFDSAFDVCERLRNAKIFSNVYCCESPYPEFNNKTTKAILLDFLRRNRDVSTRLLNSYPEITGSRYDLLLTSYPTLKAFDAKRSLVTNGETVFFDDGAGSHNGNVFRPFCIMDDVMGESIACGIKNRSAKQVMKGIIGKVSGSLFKLDVKGILLFSPTQDDFRRYQSISVGEIDISNGRNILDVVLAPEIRTADLKIPKVIFFTLPSELDEELLVQERELISKLESELKDDFGIRVHPRRRAEDFSGMNVQFISSDIIWEVLVLSGEIDENTILLGYGSTAQVSPHQLSGIEPIVIYLNHIMKVVEPEFSAVEQSKLALRNSYKSRDRVFTPESVMDLIEFINGQKGK